jgi:hypothetical protein
MCWLGLGAQIDNKTGSRIGVALNRHAAAFHLSNHSLLKAEALQVRKFLESCGVTPEGIRFSGASASQLRKAALWCGAQQDAILC